MYIMYIMVGLHAVTAAATRGAVLGAIRRRATLVSISWVSISEKYRLQSIDLVLRYFGISNTRDGRY